MARLAVVNCSQLVTLAGPPRPRVGAEMREPFIVPGAAMMIENGRIADVNYEAEIRKQIDAQTEVLDCEGKCVLPGFVDAHAHPVFAGNRVDEFEMRAQGATYEEIAAKGGGIWSTVEKTRAAEEDDLVDESRDHLEWALRCGTTTMEAKSGYGLTPGDEIKMLRVVKTLNENGTMRLVPTFLGAHSIPKGVPARDYMRTLLEVMLPAVVESGLAQYCDVFCEKGYFDLHDSSEILTRAKELGLGLRMHADQLTNSGAAMLAAALGAKTADHLEQTDEDGIRALKQGEVQPVLLPGSVYALGKTRYPLARKMIDEGLAVVLATDFNPGSSPTPSIPMAMSLACTQMKMTPAEALIAATVNAAHSLDLGGQIGSLEPGKRADFALFDTKDYREIAYYFGMQQASAVYFAGKRVFPAT
ncbi:MAG TPA: imidazolonepropionase [Fimbriimonadaceae bacterium]|nr:imidazolonepropionase [Fimbriimonadaceae bacterium]